AALRYTPPGQTRPDIKETRRDSGNADPAQQPSSKVAVSVRGATQDPPVHLAPGQKWNPADKIRFLTPKKHLERPAVVWVLNSQKQPEVRKLVLGITDGVNSEILSGDVKPGDQVIVGDSAQTGSNGAPQRGFFAFGPPPGGGGGRGGRGQ